MHNLAITIILDEGRGFRCQCAGVHGVTSMACSPGGKYTIALFPRRGFSNRHLGLHTLARGKRRQVLVSYGSLGGKECHAQGEEDDEGLHGHSKRGGVCGEIFLSCSFFQFLLPLENESSIAKIEAFLLALGGGGVNRALWG